MGTTNARSATVAVDTKPDLDRLRLVRASALADWLRARALLVVAVCAVIALSLAGVSNFLAQDGWLALVAGRQVAEHGIPQHDYFTVMAHGVRWVDQQWLGQLLMFALVRAGGLQLMTTTVVLVMSVGFAAAAAAARSLGAEDRHVLMVLPLAAFFFIVTATTIRTQAFGYPLFVAVLWLLARDLRRSEKDRRVYLVLPILVLWANLHGSVTVGVGLVCLSSLLALAQGVRERGVAGLRTVRAWILLLLAPLTLLATPYGTGMIHYYRVTLLNPEFGKLLTEWRPITSDWLLAVPFIVVAVAGCVVVGVSLRASVRARRPTPLFDVATLVVMAIGTYLAVRNVSWFGLTMVVLGAPALTRLLGGPAPLRRSTLNLGLALGAIGLTALVLAVVLSRPTSWFTRTYPAHAVATLTRLVARDPQAHIFAEIRYADWLIWRDPRLFAGRVAYDTSLELLTGRQLDEIAKLGSRPQASSRRLLAGYHIWVLNPANRQQDRRLLHWRGVRVIMRSSRVLIAINPVSATSGARS
ncbi:MAG: hypothetical protein ACP5H2_07550 [Solirubrobacteraceae bacterium]